MLDIGKELKELRLLKGLSLKEISEITKINLKYLEYLEQNNFYFLPEIYVKSFLKNYVKVLDGDEKKFMQSLEEALHPKELKEIKEIEDVKEEKKEEEVKAKKPESIYSFLIGKTNILTSRNILFLLGATIVLIIVLFLIFSRNEIAKKGERAITNEKMYEEVKENKSEKFGNIAESDSLLLAIISSDSVWIQVKMDNSKIEEVYMRKGDLRKFKAKNDFQLLVGNAGAISLKLNETELPFSGVKGSVKRLLVDRNGVKLIQVKNEPKEQQ